MKKNEKFKNKHFTCKIYNDKNLFNYVFCYYLTYKNNSCWIDCFIILYILVFKKNII